MSASFNLPSFMNRRDLLAFAGLGVGLGVGFGRGRRAWAETPKSSGPANGALLVIGGGNPDAAINRAGRELSGGGAARWVFIPTAAENASDAVVPRNLMAAGASVTTLNTFDRKLADSEAFVAPLLTATAVYFGGGRQWRIVDAYGGTRTEREIRAVLDRGGLIAGSSAGASIQGSYLVRGAPEGNNVVMAKGHERGFGYLHNVAIDQHVRTRSREGDLAQVVAAHPELLGIGIDESTAALVQRNTLTVLGRGVIFITDGARHDGRPYYMLESGTRFDLGTWTVIRS